MSPGSPGADTPTYSDYVGKKKHPSAQTYVTQKTRVTKQKEALGELRTLLKRVSQNSGSYAPEGVAKASFVGWVERMRAPT